MQYGCVINGLFQPQILWFTLVAWLFSWPAQAVLQAQTAELLDNRFRIDHSVQVISLLVARSPGSAPVVVVQPDGSKWYANRYPDNVRWSATQSSDFIRIESPTPGPWQLVGEVLEGSKLRLLTEVILRNEPIPAQVYRGERVKLTAELFSDDERIVMRDFNQQLNWQLSINSANRLGDPNIGAGPFAIGTYQDLGANLDEIPHDGLFTSELNFDFPVGLYFYKLEVENAVLHRERSGQIEILPQPVRLALGNTEDQSSRVLITTAEPSSLGAPIYLDLEIETPARERVPRSFLIEKETQEFVLDEVQSSGNYRIRGEVLGSYPDGREFLLQLPELNFYLPPPPVAPLSEIEQAIIDYETATEKEQQAQAQVLWILAVVNIGVLICAVIGLVIWRVYIKREQSEEMILNPPPDLTPDDLDLNLGRRNRS